LLGLKSLLFAWHSEAASGVVDALARAAGERIIGVRPHVDEYGTLREADETRELVRGEGVD
jgi:hypothetical protein